jgi:hypothetical protein
MKILVGIPCLFGAEHTKQAIESVINKQDVDVLLIDNGAEQSVKQVLAYYKQKGAVVIRNEQNIYVNPAWNQIMQYFILLSQYTHVVIMNSDLIMQKNWAEVLKNRWSENPDEICLPIMDVSKELVEGSVNIQISPAQRVYNGTPGVFITLSRKQVEMIYPIPERCKVWFGDNWIYDIMRALNYPTVIPENLLSHHYWSQNVSKVAGISEIIEEDKKQWNEVVQPLVLQKIKQLKSKN